MVKNFSLLLLLILVNVFVLLKIPALTASNLLRFEQRTRRRDGRDYNRSYGTRLMKTILDGLSETERTICQNKNRILNSNTATIPSVSLRPM